MKKIISTFLMAVALTKAVYGSGEYFNRSPVPGLMDFSGQSIGTYTDLERHEIIEEYEEDKLKFYCFLEHLNLHKDSLTSLSVSKNNLSSEDFKDLAEVLEGSACLQFLYVSDNKASFDGVRDFLAIVLRGCPKLKKIDVRNNEDLVDEGMIQKMFSAEEWEEIPKKILFDDLISGKKWETR